MTGPSTLIVGCGYLGRVVGRRLIGRGGRVLGTTRSSEKAKALALDGIEPVIADVLDTQSLGALPEAERVLYCVGFDRRSGASMRSVSLDGLLNSLSRLDLKKTSLVYVSSTGVYGQDDGSWVDEDSETRPTHESGRVCLEAERLVSETFAQAGGAAVILRLAGLYGPGRIIGRAGLERGEPVVGDPTRYLNLIHVEDAATVALAALDRGEKGRAYLACDDLPLPRREYYELAARLLGGPPPRFVPAPEGSPEAKRQESNKRVSNRRMKDELAVVLDYPSAAVGLEAVLRSDDRTSPTG